MCTSEALTERRAQLMKWLEIIQEETNDFECEDKSIRRVIVDAHRSIVRHFQLDIKNIDFELEKIRIDEYEKSRVAEHEEKERDHEDETESKENQ